MTLTNNDFGGYDAVSVFIVGVGVAFPSPFVHVPVVLTVILLILLISRVRTRCVRLLESFMRRGVGSSGSPSWNRHVWRSFWHRKQLEKSEESRRNVCSCCCKDELVTGIAKPGIWVCQFPGCLHRCCTDCATDGPKRQIWCRCHYRTVGGARFPPGTDSAEVCLPAMGHCPSTLAEQFQRRAKLKNLCQEDCPECEGVCLLEKGHQFRGFEHMCFWCGATGRTEEYVSDDELYEEDIQRSSTPPSCESAMSGFILTALGGYKLLLRKKSLGSGGASAEPREEPGEIEPLGAVDVALRFQDF